MVAKSTKLHLSLVDASIDDLQHALSTGLVTCVELVSAYLNRISAYDCRGPTLNSIPILNPHVFVEAEAADKRRSTGSILGPLDGIPFTVKDSYKVRGLTVASGSPAFQDLIANEDAFTVQKLREAGAVLIGKTNMCPMAAGGMQRGIYGRAESPYNADYLAAAFASGSSNGSGVSTGASFAAFGMGEETVSSGRSPASNNALVAYTPSKGAISIRGNWPLYPTCDVVVPHTRSVGDLLTLLDVITATDNITKGDFWRDQPFVKLSTPWERRPKTFQDLRVNASLHGFRIAVPLMYIGGGQTPSSSQIHISPEVIHLYRKAKADLEAAGATVVETPDFPVMDIYELANTSSSLLSELYRFPAEWNVTERSVFIAYAWEQFLQENNDFNIPSLDRVDYEDIYPPHKTDDPQLRYTEPLNRIHYEKMQSFVNSARFAQKDNKFDPRSALMSIAELGSALKALESIRKTFLDDWLVQNSIDLVALPACGDVGRSTADIDHEAAEHAWRNGVKYSNGNRAFRHLGIPSVTVPMGNIASSGMPVGLTFLGKAGDDIKLLESAFAYEQISRRRTPPKRTPALGLGRDVFSKNAIVHPVGRTGRPELKVEKCTVVPTSRDGIRIHVAGFAICTENVGAVEGSELELDIVVDGSHVPKEKIMIQRCHGTVCGRLVYDFACSIIVSEPPKQQERNRVASRKRIARDSTMVVVLAGQGRRGWKSGYLKLL